MTFGADQRIELLERGLCEVATILAGEVHDRATFARLERIVSRYELPEQGELSPWEERSIDVPGGEDDPPPDGLSAPVRPA